MAGLLGGLLGLLAGAIGGGFAGLVVGGTFLGWLESPKYPYMPGYELAAYVGIILGVLTVTPLGVILALRHSDRPKKQL